MIELKAVGRQVPVKHRPREFTKVYKTAEHVPVFLRSNNMKLRYVQGSSRKL